MFGSTAMGVEHEAFEHEISHAARTRRGVKLDTDLTADDLKELVKRYKAVYKKHVSDDFPQDPRKQLMLAINAVFKWWNGNKADRVPPHRGHPGRRAPPSTCRAWSSATWATRSATGVAFTRNPATGENKFYGEWLVNAQGEDVVAGIRTPEPISTSSQRTRCPKVYKQLDDIRRSSKSTTTTCRTSSSPSRKASSTCSSAATASGPAPRP